MKIIEVETARGDTLFGCLYGENFHDTCVIFTNGTTGNIFENKFLRVLGERLEEKNISFIYAHNSGAFQLIDTPSKEHKRSGTAFEKFDHSNEDLKAFVDYAKKAGYRNIVLGGHSYGASKVVYFLHKNPNCGISKLILASPVDSEDEIKGSKNWQSLFSIAKTMVNEGKQNQILPDLFDGYCVYSAASFVDYISNQNKNNFPVYSENKNWSQIESIQIPCLIIMGETDGFAHNNTEAHVKEILKHCKNKNSRCVVVSQTGHTFKRKENEFAQEILSFVEE